MKVLIYLTFSLIVVANITKAQEQPTVQFPVGKNLCDQTPYKLVFDEEFDGNSVDYNKWCTWNNYYGSGDNWELGRFDEQGGKTIIRDENVVISGGLARLQLWRGFYDWQCTNPSVPCPPHHTKYSSGWLTTKYGNGFAFNNGLFEARIKFPKYDYAWSTMWLYHGDVVGVNEIDIAEAHGGPFYPYGPAGKTNHFNVSHSLHCQPPDPKTQPNPYGLTDYGSTTDYPHQTWWDKYHGTYFGSDNWHTYSCQWDTNLVSFYVDNVLVDQTPKYAYYQRIPRYQSFLFFSWISGYTQVYHPAFCSPLPGIDYHITREFPWNNTSECQLRLTTQMMQDNSNQTSSDTTHTLAAEMLVDYVRCWQRHPEENGKTDLCEGIPHESIFFGGYSILGPSIICNTATYNLYSTVAAPTGTWAVSSNLVILYQSPTSVTVQRILGSLNPASDGYVQYNPGGPVACGGTPKTRHVDVGPPSLYSANVVRVKLPFAHYGAYHLFASNLYTHSSTSLSNSPNTYIWDVNYGPNYSNHVILYGADVGTPFSYYNQSTPGGISGTLTVTNGCGSTVINLLKDNSQLRITMDSDANGNSATYFNALITDTLAFKADVEQRVINRFIPDTIANDSFAITQLIERSITASLEPYLVMDDSIVGRPINTLSVNSQANGNERATFIYPNPTTGKVNIVLGDGFTTSRGEVSITMSDIYGRECLRTERASNNSFTTEVDISKLPIGIYNCTISKAGYIEHHKIIRQ